MLYGSFEEAQEIKNAQLRQAAKKHAEEQEKLDRQKDEIAKQNRTAFMKENELAIAAKKQRKLSEKEEEHDLRTNWSAKNEVHAKIHFWLGLVMLQLREQQFKSTI